LTQAGYGNSMGHAHQWVKRSRGTQQARSLKSFGRTKKTSDSNFVQSRMVNPIKLRVLVLYARGQNVSPRASGFQLTHWTQHSN